MIRNRVLLPQPEGPSNAANSPWEMIKLTFLHGGKAALSAGVDLLDVTQFEQCVVRVIGRHNYSIRYFSSAILYSRRQSRRLTTTTVTIMLRVDARSRG